MRFTGGTLTTNGADGNVLLTGATTDSRNVQPGQLFVAYRGERLDGHAFAPAACAAGAGALLVERAVAGACADVHRC